MSYSEKTKSGRRAAVQTKVQSIKRLLLFDFKRIYRLLFRMVQNQVCVLFCWGWPVCDLFFFLLEVHRAVSKHRELVFHVAAHNAYLPSL